MKRRQDSSNRTPLIKPSTAERKWYVIDAKDQVFGRLVCEIVRILRGKRKASFTPHCDNGDFVIVVNAKHFKLSGKNKGQQIKFYRHSGYMGGLKIENLEDLMQRDPCKAIMYMVNKMLPKSTNLRARLLKKLKVYASDKHPHAAQNPELLEIPVL